MTYEAERRLAMARISGCALTVLAALPLLGRTKAAAQPSTEDRNARYAMKPRWQFTRVNITDIDRSLNFYQHVLGLVIKRQRRSPDFAEIFLGFPGDSPLSTSIMLIFRKGATVPNGSSESIGLAFETTNAQRACDLAKANGGVVNRLPQESGHEARRPGEGAIFTAIITDPDGHHIELVEYRK